MQDLTWDAVETSKPNRKKTDRNVEWDYLNLSNKKLLFNAVKHFSTVYTNKYDPGEHDLHLRDDALSRANGRQVSEV